MISQSNVRRCISGCSLMLSLLIGLSGILHAQSNGVQHESLQSLVQRYLPSAPTSIDELRAMARPQGQFHDIHAATLDSARERVQTLVMQMSTSSSGSTSVDMSGVNAPSSEQQQNMTDLAAAMNDPEVREKLMKMSPQEQQKFLLSLRKQMNVPEGKTKGSAPRSAVMTREQLAIVSKLPSDADCLGSRLHCSNAQELQQLLDSIATIVSSLNEEHDQIENSISEKVRELYASVHEDKKVFESRVASLYKQQCARHDSAYTVELNSMRGAEQRFWSLLGTSMTVTQSDIDALNYGDGNQSVAIQIRSIQMQLLQQVQLCIEKRVQFADAFYVHALRYSEFQSNPSVIYNYFN